MMSFLLTEDLVDAELILLLDLDGNCGTSLITLLDLDDLCCCCCLVLPSTEETTDTLLTMLLDRELIPGLLLMLFLVFLELPGLLLLGLTTLSPRSSLVTDSGVEDLCCVWCLPVLKGANLFLRDFSLGKPTAELPLGIGLMGLWPAVLSPPPRGEQTKGLLAALLLAVV